MILLGLLRPYGRDETVARIVLSSSIDCFGLNRTQVIDSGLIIFLNEFRNRYHARSRFRSFLEIGSVVAVDSAAPPPFGNPSEFFFKKLIPLELANYVMYVCCV